MSAAVAPPRFTIASVCRREIPAAPRSVALGESRLLHQPRCRKLAKSLACGIAGQDEAARAQLRLKIFELVLRDNRVLEERSRAARVIIAGDDEHRLAVTNLAHRGTHR